MRGFTLIEVVIYTALLGVILGTALTTLYPLLEATHRQSETVSDSLEGAFLTQKIGWLMSMARTVEVPLAGATSSTLTITTRDHETHGLRLHDGALEISIDSDPFTPLSRSKTIVQNFTVTHTPASTTNLRIIEISFTLNDVVYGPLLYEQLY